MPLFKLLCSFCVLLLSTESMAAKVTLMVEDFPPYIKRYEQNKGIMTDLVVEAFSRVKVGAELKYGSWLAVEQALNDERILSFMWLKTKPRLKKWHYSQPIYQQRLKFVARKDFSTDINYLHNLRNHKIALVSGIRYGDQIQSIRNRLKVTEVASDYAALVSLLDGKTDVIAVDPIVVADLLRNYYPAEVRKQLKFIETSHFKATPYYLVCGKNYGNCTSYIKKFNRGLAMMTADGSMSNLLKTAESLQ